LLTLMLLQRALRCWLRQLMRRRVLASQTDRQRRCLPRTQRQVLLLLRMRLLQRRQRCCLLCLLRSCLPGKH